MILPGIDEANLLERGSAAARGLRLLGFCDYFGTGTSGGAEKVALETWRLLSGWGAVVVVVAVRPRHAIPVATGIETIYVPGHDLSPAIGVQLTLAGHPGRAAAAAITRHRPHVLHAHSLHFQGTVVAARLARAVPLVTTAHVASATALPVGVRQLTQAHEQLVGRYILRRSTHAIAVSRSVAEHVTGLGRPNLPITVVPNGVDHATFRPPTRSPQQGPVSIAFVGRLIGNKGPDLLLHALTQLHREGVAFSATFIGDGPMRSDLQHASSRSGLGDVVRFAGHVHDVAPHLAAADIVVRPSLSEGMPLTILEAMAMGTCVVASAVPGTTDVVEDGRTGLLFAPRDASALADSLRRVIADTALRERLGAAGAEEATRYSWERTAALTALVLASTAGRAEATTR